MKAVLLLLSVTLTTQTSHPASLTNGVDDPKPVTLETMRDHTRPLLVFAPTDKDPRFRHQVHLFAASAGQMYDRQVILVPVTQRSEAKSWGVVLSPLAQGKLPKEEQDRARRSFGISPSAFTVILLGKDGGEKLRSSKPVTTENLIQTIDAMPMRQQEMQQKPKAP